MNNTDLITVGVAIYNAEKYVSTMIESIINQTYKNLEIMLVDDGSTDSSLEICKAFEDERIRIISKENGGLSTARQAVIDNACGAYICMVDADDYLSFDYIDELYGSIKKNNADIAVCSYRQYDDAGFERFVDIKHTASVENITLKKIEADYYNIGVNFILSDSWNKMYRAAFIKNTGIMFKMPREYNGTDWMFNYLLALHQPIIACVDKPLYNYQILQNSRVRRKDKDLQTGFMLIIKSLTEECVRLNYTQAVKAQINKIYFDLIRSALSDRFVNSENYKDFKDRLNVFKKKFNDFNKEMHINEKNCPISNGMKMFLLLIKLPATYPMYAYLKKRTSYIKTFVKKQVGSSDV